MAGKRMTNMNSAMPSDDWLQKKNDELRAKDIHPRQRPWLVLIEWLKITGKATQLREPDVKRIFDWFSANTKPGSQAMGPVFTGVIYFDGCMWPIDMPLVLGRVTLNASNSLDTMPGAIKDALLNNQQERIRYVSVWCDCAAYCYGLANLIASVRGNPFALELLRSADMQLRASATLLLAPNPDQKSTESSRLAIEMFLKVFLAVCDSLTEETAKQRYGHDLIKSAKRCAEVFPCSEFDYSIEMVKYFPAIGDRYKAIPVSLQDLAMAFYLTLHTAAHIVRTLTGTGIKPQFQGQGNPK
jgi:hypothetical protein